MDRVLEPTSNCVDVGAHDGVILAEMVRRAPLGRHFAFEPLPAQFQTLKRRFAGATMSTGVRLYQVALSDHEGTAPFYRVNADTHYSGLMPRRYPFSDPQIDTFDVAVGRLDALLPDGVPIRFVKVDVEGGEVAVLRGAFHRLATDRPYVVFEHGLGGADSYDSGPDDILGVIRPCALNLSTLSGWLDGDAPLSDAAFRRCFDEGREFYYLAHP